MKKESVMTLVSVILIIIVCLVLWKDEIFKPSQKVYHNRIIITNKQTGDTIYNKDILTLSPMELDSLTLYLNKR